MIKQQIDAKVPQWTTRIVEALGATERLLNSQLITAHTSIAGLVGQARGIAGKRLRPILLLLSAKTVGEPNAESIRLAAVVELLHTATLVHDDVLDGALMRRARPTVHSVWGAKSSILLGDLLFTKAYELATNCHSTYPARVIARCAAEICEGEMRQQAAVGNWRMSQREYLDILRQKTAELCATSCTLGAWTLDAEPTIVEALDNYGRYLGIAFQLFDDWLDIWGTQEAGKTLGSDLSERKPTLPIIRLLSQAGSSDRETLIGLLDAADHQSLGIVRTRLDESDASDFTRTAAVQMVKQAIGELESLPRNGTRESLEQLAWYSVHRAA